MIQSTGDRPLLILTGASGRFGRAFLKAYESQFDVIAISHESRLPVAGENVAFDAVTRHKTAYPIRQVHCDLSDIDAIKTTFEQICQLCGTPHYLINCAADVKFHGTMLSMHDVAHKAVRQYTINALAPAIIASVMFELRWKHVPPGQQRASVLNLSSVSGVRFFKGGAQGSYAASKAALNMLTLYMADEYLPYRVCVNALAPGRFETEAETAAVAQRAFSLLTNGKTGQIVIDQ
jgi:NAD(P)-dependent dehydrogenase (short-subunit alcohol dehydrogenase family)